MVPDTQIKPGVPLDHIKWIANYIVDKRPDELTLIGDWADMASLSSYDVGKKAFEGRKYTDDIAVANEALAMLCGPIDAELARIERGHRTRWNLRKRITLGNHENRIVRAVNNDRKLEGLIGIGDLRFKEFGFDVHPFLETVSVDGVAYCHYFVSGVMGRPVTTARALLQKKYMSCFAGHQQGYDVATAYRGDGNRITSIICGSCYLHEEDFLGPQGNKHFRGLVMLNEVADGSFDEMKISLDYLRDKYA